MRPPQLWIAQGGGPVSLRVELDTPGAVVAVVWRFPQPARRDGAVGEIHRDAPELPLGAPGIVAGCGFLVDGYVVPPATPSPYRVVVTLLQDGTVLHRAIPRDHGSGILTAGEVRFRYPFRLCPSAGQTRGHRPGR